MPIACITWRSHFDEVIARKFAYHVDDELVAVIATVLLETAREIVLLAVELLVWRMVEATVFE